MKDVIEYLKKDLKKEDTVILGLSGGPDSMCLLSLIISLNMNIKIVCAHVNHKVRKESDEEYKYLEKFCSEKSLIFEGYEIKETIVGNFESNARKIRYKFYEDLQKKYNAKYILTAHHGDDLIETILMRISRGSNINGYAGIKIKEGPFLRPLLLTTKDEILEYLKENNICYFWDKTNDEDIHTRNRYRHNVIPFLKKENENIHKKYLEFSKKLTEYDEFVNNYVEQTKILNYNEIDLKKFNTESTFIQQRIIENAIKNLQKDNIFEITGKNINDVLTICKSNKSNVKINLPSGFVARKSYDKLLIEKEINKQNVNIVFNRKYENKNIILTNKVITKEKSNFVIRLNSDEIKLPLHIRNRMPNDKMYVKNLGNKKVKDIFIDEKIDIKERDEILLLTDDDNNILWILGIKKSKFDKELNEKYDIILKCERKLTNE